MNVSFNYWELLAGLALFLFAMAQIEGSLKAIGGRSLSQYLRKQTGRPLNAALSGVLSTALLQSSSMVGLMVLAFTGAGLLSLTSALGIIFGSNLGTTATGWIVATIGFKFELSDLALPMIALGGFAFLFGKNRWTEGGRALLSLGLLLLGLELMKNSVVSAEEIVDIETLAGRALWQYLIFGTVLAAVIQSSSACMMIWLAALHAGIIALPDAAALAIGADLGTTLTVAIGAVNGSAIKKQVAAGHVLFNLATAVIAFAALRPLLAVVAMLGITSPLYSLVAFHSLFNLLGVLLFLPITAAFARKLEQLIPAHEALEASYLSEVNSTISEAALDASERETSLLIARVIHLTKTVFQPPLATPAGNSPVPYLRGMERISSRSFDALYHATKKLEGELVGFTIQLQSTELNASDSARLSQLLSAAREAMYGAKAVKDIYHNLAELRDSTSDETDRYDRLFRETSQSFINDLWQLRQYANENGDEQETVSFEALNHILTNTFKRHDAIHNTIYTDIRNHTVTQSLLSSLLNVNRELLSSHRAVTLALGHYYLSEAQQEALERSLD